MGPRAGTGAEQWFAVCGCRARRPVEPDRLRTGLRAVPRPDIPGARRKKLGCCFGADRIVTPVPAHLTNCLRTLRLLYVLADRGGRWDDDSAPQPLQHREAVKERIGAVLDRIVKR